MKKIYKYIIVYFLLLLISCSGGGGSSEDSSYQYHTPEDIDIFLDEIKLNYPHITSIETVGYTESGRMIKALVISDNPGTLEGEPAVRLTGGIHGNEMMSVELLIRFIEYLTYNYSTNTEIKNLIDNRYICIIPVLNPDGLAAKSRYNRNGVDLNRNFDDADNHWISDSRSGSSPFSESESRALRDFSVPKNFNLSITYHTGAVLVNLPFDFGKEIEGVYPEQNDLIKSYAKTYTNAGGGVFLTNPDIYVSPYMSADGWINGGNWYVAYGTLQDWSYTVTSCLDLTIEVARRSPATEEGVQQVFMYNRDSIVAYIGRAGEVVFTGE
jgi:hypothetical protein